MPPYDAFISYSHAKDKAIASALQSAVQKLGKPWYKRRALRVFRDDTSLSATPHLWPSIEQALGQTRYFLLLASPEAAASKWVNKEVAHWLHRNSIDTLLIGVTDGELAWNDTIGDFAASEKTPLPPALAGRFPMEPKWVDLRPYRDGADKADAKFTELAADFAATIREMPKEDLLSQEVRQQRRSLTMAWSAAGSLLVFAGMVVWLWMKAIDAEHAAIEQSRIAQQQRDIARAQRELAERNFGMAHYTADRVVHDMAKGLRNVEGIRIGIIQQVLDTTRLMVDALAQSAPDDLRLQRSRAAMLREFAQTYRSAGDFPHFKASADESLTIMNKLVAADGNNIDWQIELSESRALAADALLVVGQRDEAIEQFRLNVAAAEGLSNAAPGDVSRKISVLEAHANIGHALAKAAKWDEAIAEYNINLSIAQAALAERPDEQSFQAAVSVAHLHIAELIKNRGGPWDDALDHYDKALPIAEKNAADFPQNTSVQDNLLTLQNGIGEVLKKMGRREEAIAAYRKATGTAERLAGLDPENAVWQTDLAVSHGRMGDALLAAAYWDEALVEFKKGLIITEKLAAASPEDVQQQTNLMVLLYNAATAGYKPQETFTRALEIARKLDLQKKLPPTYSGWPNRIADALVALGGSKR